MQENGIVIENDRGKINGNDKIRREIVNANASDAVYTVAAAVGVAAIAALCLFSDSESDSPGVSSCFKDSE